MRLFSILFAFAFLFAISSCQREVDANGSSSSNSTSGKITARIDGTPWASDKATAASRFSGFISIGGISVGKQFIAITLTDSGVHKYILSDESLNVAALIDSTEAQPINYTTNQGNYPSNAGGEVIISSIDVNKKTISGSFSFNVFRVLDGKQKKITQGSFTNLPYATQMPQAASTDTFRVKINGTLWTPHAISALTFTDQIVISAGSADGAQSAGFFIPGNAKPGNYNFDSFASEVIGQYNPSMDPARSKLAVSGTMTILENNFSTKRIRGNFAFRGEEILNPAGFTTLSEGYFSVKY